MYEPLGLQRFEHISVLAFAVDDHGRKDQQPLAWGLCENTLDDRLGALTLDRSIALRTPRGPGSGEESRR